MENTELKIVPTVAITYPIGGETFYVGDNVKVTWVTSFDTYNTLDILVLVNDSWKVIGSDIPISYHEYHWLIDDTEVCEDAILKIASASIGNSPQTGPFSIKKASPCPIFNFLLRSYTRALRRWRSR